MSGPWVNYQAPSAPADGPWSKYGGETPAAQAAQPQGFWDKVKDSLKSRNALDAPGAKAYHSDSPLPGSTEGHGMLGGLHDWDKASGGEIGGGVGDILKGDVAKGLHRIISGTGAAAAPAAPFMLPLAAAAPITTGLSIGGGALGAKGAQAGAKALGATPDQQDLAGDIGGLAGGYAGAKLPGLGSRALLLGKTPQQAYQSALKPSTTLAPAKVAGMVDTGLKQEIPVSKNGLDKLGDLLTDLHEKVADLIGSGQGKTVNPFKVTARLGDTAKRFATQVNPESDLNAVAASGNEFLRNNPGPIPAADAQAMKQGTYQQLSGKAYGEMQTATKEAQKALARGIKEELASQFPELSKLNSQESKLYDLEGSLEKAVQRVGNSQGIGLGTPTTAAAAKAITGSNKIAGTAGFLKAVLDNPAIKSRLAIAMFKSGVPMGAARARILAFENGLAQAALSPSNDPNSPDDRASASGGTPTP